MVAIGTSENYRMVHVMKMQMFRAEWRPPRLRVNVLQKKIASWTYFCPRVQNAQFILHPYTFSVSAISSLLARVFMLRIHTNPAAHDSGDATRAYPPYLIRLDSE